jgi:hypothetical protein
MKIVLRAMVAIAVMFAIAAPALVMRALSIEELTRAADIVVQGVVTNKVCLQTPEGRIYTRVDVVVSEEVKGKAGTNVLSIVHGGGAFGGKRVDVEGQVDYQVGDEVLAFLVFNQRHQAVTLGLCQGKFDISRDGQSGEKFARNPFHGTPDTPAGVSKASVSSGNPASVRLRLTDLKQQIRKTNP